MLEWFLAGYAVAQWVDKKWIRPTPEPDKLRPQGLSSFKLPRAVEGDPVPLFYGRVRIDAPNVIWAGNLDPVPLTEGSTEGFRYLLGMLFSLGIPGQAGSATLVSSLKKLWIGERLAWSGVIKVETDVRGVNKPTLLGGPGQGGGVRGVICYLPGNFTQVIPDLVKNTMAVGGMDATLIPSYRGQAVVALVDLSSKGWTVGESPNLDAYSYEAQSVCKVSAIGDYGGIGDGDANPANVIYDLLTESWGKAGISASLVDAVTFEEAAAILDEEDHGFSVYWPEGSSVQEKIDIVLAQIDGILYFDPLVAKYQLKLIREDYTVGLLPVYDEDNVVSVDEYSTSTYQEVFNQVKVTYNSRARKYKPAVEPASDDALITAMGRIRTAEVNYPGCTTAALAVQLAARDLRTLSLPLAKCRITVDRSAFRFPPGGRFVLNWADYNVTGKVFIIARISRGKPGDEGIVLECLQDKFSFDYAWHPPLSWDTLPLEVPEPVEVKLVEEAPRWLQRRAAAAALLGGVEEQHLHYLAEEPSDTTTGYQGRVSMDDGASFVDDTPVSEFPTTGRVSTLYARTAEPYDTTVGFYVDMLDGAVPPNVDDTLIAALGMGMMFVCEVDDDGHPVPETVEIMAYETATLDSGTVYLLENVWRGLLDTVPREHAVGSVVFFLNLGFTTNYGLRRFGGQWHDLDEAVVSRVRSVGGFGSTDPSEATSFVTTTVRLRHLMPYPPADLQVAGDKVEVNLTAEGEAGASWARRDRFSTTITRGDAASETVEPEITYVVRATKDVDGSPGTNGATDLVTGLTGSTTAEIPMGAAGYGPLDISVQARRPYTTEAGVDVTLASWQEPKLRVNAPEYRQMLINPALTDAVDLNHWTIESGAPEVYDDGAGHIWIIGTAIASWSVSQTVDVRGYQPARLSAVLHFLAQNASGEVDDTLTVTLESLDAALSVLDTSTSGPTAWPTTSASRDKVTILSLDPDTVYLRVTVTSTEVGSPVAATAWAGDFSLRLGQMDSALSNLLDNNDFEAGTFTSWVNDDDSFVADTAAPLHTLTRYARPGDFATSQISQSITPPAGYTVGAYAVLRFARANHNADGDLGQVVLQARDSSPGTVDEEYTAMEAITPVDTWVMKQLVLELPHDTATVKTLLKGQRTSGTPCDTAFDDMHLMIWKKLDPSQMWEYRYDEPPKQALPLNRYQWGLAFPDVPVPTLGWWVGDSWQGTLGIEPDMEPEDDADAMIVEAPFVGCWSGETMVSQALECYKRTHSIRTETNRSFANFDSSQPFTVRVVFKTAEPSPNGTSGELAGRHAGAVGASGLGWSLTTMDDGTLLAKLVGASGEANAAISENFYGRFPEWGAIVYDPGASELRAVSRFGVTAVSTAAIGEFGVLGEHFTIGDDFLGQIASVEVWGEAIPSADLQAMWAFGTNPSDAGTTQTFTRTAFSAACPVGYTDGFGARVTAYAPGHIPLAWLDAADDDGGTGFGLAATPAFANQVPISAQISQTPWTTAGLAVTTFNVEAGPEGFRDAILVTESNGATDYLELTGITISAGANQRGVWFARADAAGTARARLHNSSGVLKETFDFDVDTEWTRVSHLFTAWDNSTANATIRFRNLGGSAETLYLAGPFFLGETTDDPLLIPSSYVAESGGPLTIEDDFGGAALLANEGEIEWTGAFMLGSPGNVGELLALSNASVGDNSRNLSIVASAPGFDHADGTAAVVTATGTVVATWDTVQTIRGRWCRAGLLDAAAAFTTVINGNTFADDMDIGRATVWTPDGTAMEELQIGAVSALVRVVRVYTRESRLPLA